MLEKRELRKRIIAIRSEMQSEEAHFLSNQICEKIQSLQEYKQAENILAYMSINNEVELKGVIDNALKSGKKVYIPKVVSKTEMKFYQYDGSFSEGSFGILEPEKCNEETLYTYKEKSNTLVIIPGVAFDKNRNRLGYGGGFYDSFLGGLKSTGISKVAVAYELQIVDEVPSEQHDLKPDTIITEKRIIM